MAHADLTETRHTMELGDVKFWECSECGHSFEEIFSLYPRCPHCGEIFDNYTDYCIQNNLLIEMENSNE